MGRYDPWRDLSDRAYLRVEFVDMPTGRRGVIRGNLIMIDRDQLQTERRSTIAHELVHDERRVFPADGALRARDWNTFAAGLGCGPEMMVPDGEAARTDP